MSDFFANFQQEPDFDSDRRVWTTAKPFLNDWAVQVSPYDADFLDYRLPESGPGILEPSCPYGRVTREEVTVFVYEATEESADLLEKTWNDLLANLSAVEKSLVTKLQAVHLRNITQFLEEEMPEMPEYAAEWEKSLAKLGKPPEEAASAFFKLVGIGLSTQEMDGIGFTAFEFQSGWDLDHGLEITMHRDRVLTSDGLTVLISSDYSIVDGARANQEFEFDPGDLRL
jgi:hypothetical protein